MRVARPCRADGETPRHLIVLRLPRNCFPRFSPAGAPSPAGGTARAERYHRAVSRGRLPTRLQAYPWPHVPSEELEKLAMSRPMPWPQRVDLRRPLSGSIPAAGAGEKRSQERGKVDGSEGQAERDSHLR